jgi:hypothetical protein
LTKVWIVSGFVLIGTGLALAGFGAWLSGNTNCDAGDLGRSCVAASLGVAVIGAALTTAGWLRVKRMAETNSSEESGGMLAKRPGLVMVAFAVVGLIVLTIALPGPQVPVNVFQGAAPAIDTLPANFTLPSLAGLNRTDLSIVENQRNIAAEAGFEGGVFVRVTRFNASVNWTPPPPNWNETLNEPFWKDKFNYSVENATGVADGFLSAQYSAIGPSESSRVCVREGPRLWFTAGNATKSELAWRHGTFVFEVFAPTVAVRNQVALALSAAA